MFDLNIEEIDIYRIGVWPLYLKLIVVFVSCALIYMFCHWAFIESQIERLDNLKAEEQRLRTFFLTKHKQLINVAEYKDQMGMIKNRLAKLVRKLPGANELPSLINEVSQAGNDSGLEIKEIKILSEKKFKYYVELPIQITVDGNYHQISDFISKVSGMPRVVTFHDFSLETIKKQHDNKDHNLSLDILAKTYRYLASEHNEDDETAVSNEKS